MTFPPAASAADSKGEGAALTLSDSNLPSSVTASAISRANAPLRNDVPRRREVAGDSHESSIESLLKDIKEFSSTAEGLVQLRERLKESKEFINSIDYETLDQHISELNVSQQFLGYMYLLEAMIRTEQTSGGSGVALLFSEFIEKCEVNDIQLEAEKFISICRSYKEYWISYQKPGRGVYTMMRAVTKLQSTTPPGKLTPLHGDFLHLCVQAQNYHAGFNHLEKDVDETDLKPTDLCQYYYNGWLICMKLNKIEEAYGILHKIVRLGRFAEISKVAREAELALHRVLEEELNCLSMDYIDLVEANEVGFAQCVLITVMENKELERCIISAGDRLARCSNHTIEMTQEKIQYFLKEIKENLGPNKHFPVNIADNVDFGYDKGNPPTLVRYLHALNSLGAAGKKEWLPMKAIGVTNGNEVIKVDIVDDGEKRSNLKCYLLSLKNRKIELEEINDDSIKVSKAAVQELKAECDYLRCKLGIPDLELNGFLSSRVKNRMLARLCTSVQYELLVAEGHVKGQPPG